MVNYTSTQNKSLNIPTQVYKKLAFSAVTKGPTLTESTLPIENYKLSQKKGEGLHNFMRKRYIHFSIIHQALKVRHILARRWSPSLDVFLLFKKKPQIFTPEFNTCLQYNTKSWSTFALSAPSFAFFAWKYLRLAYNVKYQPACWALGICRIATSSSAYRYLMNK